MWTIPNLLTLSRIVAVPLLVAAMWGRDRTGYWIGFALFVTAAATDWLDGWLARRNGQTSALGRFLDPIADKVMIAAVLILLLAQGYIAHAGVVATMIVLIRELVVSGLREYLGPLGVVMPVSRLAKWKTATQMLALSLLILTPLRLGLEIAVAGALLLWVAAILSLVTGWSYLRIGFAHMKAV